MASVSWLEKLQEGFCKQKEQKRSTPDKTRYAFPPSPPPINVERHGWMFFSERKNSFRRRTLLGGGRGGPGSKRMRTLVLSGVVRIRARCVSPCATTCCALLAGPQLCSCAGVRLSSAALGGAAPQPFHGGDGPRMLCHGGSSFWFKHAVLAWAFGQRRPRRPHLHLAAEFDKRYRCRAVRDPR